MHHHKWVHVIFEMAHDCAAFREVSQILDTLTDHDDIHALYVTGEEAEPRPAYDCSDPDPPDGAIDNPAMDQP